METTKNITAADIARTERPHAADTYRIDDPRDEIVRQLEAAWQRALDELFAERRAA
jgi:hypothetical protein